MYEGGRERERSSEEGREEGREKIKIEKRERVVSLFYVRERMVEEKGLYMEG